MAMVNTPPPKHKPNEKHTLDEVLKSLNDLVRGNVLDKPSASPAPAAKKPAAPPKPAASSQADMSDILKSLENLLDDDLNPHDRPAAPKPAPLAHTPKAKQPEPAKPVTRKPKPEPEPPNTAATSAASDVLSEADLVKALEEISFDTDFALDVKNAEAEIEAIDAAALPEPDSIVFDETETLAPEPELIMETPAADVGLTHESTDLAQSDTHNELSFDASGDAADGFGSVENEIEAAPPPAADTGLEFTEQEINPAPPPANVASGLEVVEARPNTMSLADELASIDFAVDDLEPARAPSSDDFSVEFTPSKKSKPRQDEPTPEPVSTEAPATEEIEAAAPIEEIEAPLPAGDFSFEETQPDSAPAIEPQAEDLAPPPSTDNYSDIIERAEPPVTPVGGGNSLGSLGEFKELDFSDSNSGSIDFTTSELTEIESEPVAEPAPPAPKTATVSATPKPKPKPAPEPKEIPVLKDVAVSPPAEDFSLQLSPPIRPTVKKPAAEPQDLHQTAVRVIAKLNIELRKSGKPPLDAKAIYRLQQLLKEALENRKK
jgi:hypothetical protein